MLAQFALRFPLGRLVGALVAARGEAEPRALADAVWAVAKLGVKKDDVDPALLQTLVAKLAARHRDARAEHLGNAAWALATLELADTDPATPVDILRNEHFFQIERAAWHSYGPGPHSC